MSEWFFFVWNPIPISLDYAYAPQSGTVQHHACATGCTSVDVLCPTPQSLMFFPLVGIVQLCVNGRYIDLVRVLVCG